jgi:hypothetical protein
MAVALGHLEAQAPGVPEHHRRLDHARRGEGGLPRELAHLHQLLARGLAMIAVAWPSLLLAYGWVREAAHLLANEPGRSAEVVRTRYQTLRKTMANQRDALGPWPRPSTTSGRSPPVTGRGCSLVTTCQICRGRATIGSTSSARYHERRASGHKQAASRPLHQPHRAPHDGRDAAAPLPGHRSPACRPDHLVATVPGAQLSSRRSPRTAALPAGSGNVPRQARSALPKPALPS